MAMILAMAAVSGCASYPAPELQLAASRGAIERAAGGDVSLAREKMALAQHLSSSGAQQSARWLAEQAQVDAELANARASATRAADEASRWQQSVRAIRASYAVY